MDASRFDRVARELATVKSRRGVLKMLAGAAVALGAAAAVAPSSLAVTCADAGGDCTVDEDCCGRLTCGEDGTCGGPSAGCVGANEDCTADEDCCGRLTCREDGTCGGPSAGSECTADGDCATDEICCGGICAQIACCIDDDDPNARCPEGTSCFEGYCDPVDGGTDGVTSLPVTGAGVQVQKGETAGWLLGAAAIGGAALAGAGRLLRRRDDAA